MPQMKLNGLLDSNAITLVVNFEPDESWRVTTACHDNHGRIIDKARSGKLTVPPGGSLDEAVLGWASSVLMAWCNGTVHQTLLAHDVARFTAELGRLTAHS